MNREQLEELSKKELIEHAEVQGVKINAPIDTKGTIIDKILGDYRPSTTQAEAAMPKEGGLYDLQGNKIKTKMYKLTIFSTENDKNDVDLIVNGHNLRVKRNVEVEVSEPYIELLRNSVITTSVQDPDTGRMYPTSIMTYPHQAMPC